MIDAVLFDWGGTLTPFASIEMEDMWRLAAEHLEPHVPEDAERLTARLMEVERAFWARTARDARAGSLADLLAEAAATIGEDVTQAVLEEAGVRYLDAWTPHITHDPDAVPVLRALRERGLRIGLLSNTHWPETFHERFLERDGLAALIDRRFYTSSMEFMKPHPAAFRTALDGLEIEDPGRVVFVGDRPFDDIHGARRVGMRAVHRPNESVPAYDVEPHASISSLHELVDLVDRWSRA